MAKKQTRRSISVSRMTYERLKAFCEANNISMSQLVETRVNDFLGEGSVTGVEPRPTQSPNRPTMPAPARPQPGPAPAKQSTDAAAAAPTRTSSPVIPMTSAAARFAVDPPPPIIKPKQETAAPKPAEKTANQIFTF